MDESIITSSPYNRSEIYKLQTIVSNHNGFDSINDGNCLQTLNTRIVKETLWINNKNLKMFSTGVAKIDSTVAFNNGIPSNILCEIIGTSNSGKTTFIYQIAIVRLLNQIIVDDDKINQKINDKIIFIDCLNQFKIKRFVQMCNEWIHHKLKEKPKMNNDDDTVKAILETILRNVVIKNAMTFAQLYLTIYEIERDCKKRGNIDLILIDNFGLNILVKQYGSTFDDIFDIHKLGRKLKIIARNYNCTIIVTNTANQEKGFRSNPNVQGNNSNNNSNSNSNSNSNGNNNDNNNNSNSNNGSNHTYWHLCDWSLKTTWTHVFPDLVFFISVTNVGAGNILNISTIKSNVSSRYSYALAHMTNRGIIDYDRLHLLEMSDFCF